MAILLNHFDILRVTVVSQLAPQVALTRFHYLVGTIVGAPTDIDAATDADTQFGALWKAAMSSAATYRGVSAQVMRPMPVATPTFWQMFRAQPITVNSGLGTRGATPLPGQVRGIVSFRGALAVRGLNARMYMPFPSTADTSADGFTPTGGYHIALLGVGSAALSFVGITDSGGNVTPISLVDWAPTGTKHLDPGVRQGSTGITAQTKWATQRRSGAYGRPNTPPF